MNVELGNVYPKAKANIVRMDADGEVILYDASTMRTHVLTEMSAFVLDLCDGKTNVPSIQARLNERNANVGDDVALVALHRLSKAGLVEGFNQKPWDTVTSRRETLKRIAMLGGAMMMPRIISIKSAREFQPAMGGTKCTATLGCASGYICCNQGNADPSNCQCELIVPGFDTCAKFGKEICTR